MAQRYTAVIKQDGDLWVGWIKEFPGVNCQEYSKEELLTSLCRTLLETLQESVTRRSRKGLLDLMGTLKWDEAYDNKGERHRQA